MDVFQRKTGPRRAPPELARSLSGERGVSDRLSLVSDIEFTHSDRHPNEIPYFLHLLFW